MFADYGQPSQAAQPSFVEIPNPRVTTTMGRMEVTDVRPETVTVACWMTKTTRYRKTDSQFTSAFGKLEILCATERANMMSWWQLEEQAVDRTQHARKYSIESLINRLDGLKLDEIYALRTFVCLESDPFKRIRVASTATYPTCRLGFPQCEFFVASNKTN
jgi:hypothetical protein